MSQATLAGIINTTFQQFLEKYQDQSVEARIRSLEWGPQTSLGRFVTVEDAYRVKRFYLITDFPASATQAVSGTVTEILSMFDPATGVTDTLVQASDQGAGVGQLQVGFASNAVLTVAPRGTPSTQLVEVLTGNPVGTEGGMIVRPIDAGGLADSIAIGGQATAPVAGATIATMTPGVAGVYEVYAHAIIGLGVPAAGDESNMGLYLTATLKQKLPYTGNTGGPFGPYRLTLTALNTLNIKAIANGTAGVEYVAGITCRRVG